MSDDHSPLERTKALLDARHKWPVDFVFKFIVPIAQKDALLALFPSEPVAIRPSSAGKYISVTVTLNMKSSDEVLAVYARTAGIPGLIAL